MIGKVIITSHLPFGLDGTQPKRLVVRCVSAPEDATQVFAIIADHGWAERILCSGCSLVDAVEIAETICEALLIPVVTDEA